MTVFDDNVSSTRYLVEERLEIQVWMSHGTFEDKLLPRADDEHVGSGYVSLTEIVEFTGTKAISRQYFNDLIIILTRASNYVQKCLFQCLSHC